jgi:predicted nucleic acid-binding protein
MGQTMSYLLDSVILIDHLNGVAGATRFIKRLAGELAVSAITRAEVLTGFDEVDVPLGIALLDNFRFLPMDAEVADEAARFRRQTRLKLPDAIQAAFATRHGLKLATRNIRDFPPKKFSFVAIPYRLR